MKTKLYLKNISKNALLSLSTLALLSGSLMAGSAHAADGKDYPGTHCMPKDSDQVFVATVGGAMMNPSGTKSLTVICPGVNDAGTNFTGSVTYYDGNPQTTTDGQDLAPVSCYMESRTRGGGFLDKTLPQKSKVGQGTGTLFFNTRALANQPNAYFYFVCDLPVAVNNPLRFSQILSYEFDEQ